MRRSIKIKNACEHVLKLCGVDIPDELKKIPIEVEDDEDTLSDSIEK